MRAGGICSTYSVRPPTFPADLEIVIFQIDRLGIMKPGPEDQNNSLRRQVYLLTCWQERDSSFGLVTWRYRLEAPGYDQHYLFRSLTEVMSKIENELENNDRPSES